MPPPKGQSQREDTSIVEPFAPLPGKLLYDLWRQVPEAFKYAFVAEALSERAAERLRHYQVQRYEQAGRAGDWPLVCAGGEP